MISSSKITLRSQMGSGAKYAFQKVPMIMKTVFQLALINAYDKDMRIRDKNGVYIENSNLMDLMNHAMSVGKPLRACEEFIDLLAEAKVDPDWIINQNVKQMLVNKLSSTDGKQSDTIDKPKNPITTGAYWGPEKENERKLATYTQPPKLKLRPLTLTPPTSPPSPFKKNYPASSPDMPTLKRIDLPPASPPVQMPSLKRMRIADDEDEEPGAKRIRQEDNNKSDDPWLQPPPDDDDDW